MRDEVYWMKLLDKIWSDWRERESKKHSIERKILDKKIKNILKRLNKKRK